MPPAKRPSPAVTGHRKSASYDDPDCRAQHRRASRAGHWQTRLRYVFARGHGHGSGGQCGYGGREHESRCGSRSNALRFYREFMAHAPDNLIVYAGLSTSPDGEQRLGMRPVFNGLIAEGDSLLRPLRRFGTPVMDDIAPRPYVEIQKIVEPMFPPGRLNYWKANFVDHLSDDLFDLLVAAYRRVPSRYSNIALEPMGGAIARVPETATAFHHRTHAYSLLLLGGWVDPAETESNVTWVRELWDLTQPLSSSAVYVNYLGSEGQGRVLEAYGPNHARLSAIKAKYDPGNFFRLNQNVEPATSA